MLEVKFNMKDGVRDTLVFDMKDFRHEDSKAYEALVPPAPLGLNYEEVEFLNALSCAVRLFRQGDDNIYVTADIETKILVECGRCITPFEVDIATAFELLFSIGSESSEESEADERYYDGETLDISEDVRQALVLEIPAWPLCSETCEGLCPQCGAELNISACSCEPTDEAPASPSNPFAVLSKMLEKS
ncbi:MAG: DUF177 domain-containing protein [Candidatus Poribacteria bacterium]|nr:DUF177 domain-containing protein [Candidatus Poribacteria bacterium]